MSWVGLCDGRKALFDFGGLPLVEDPKPNRRKLLTNRPDAPLATRGTLMLEAEISHFTNRRRLLDFEGKTSNNDGRPRFEIQLCMTADAQLEFSMRLDDQTWSHRLRADISEPGHTMRVTFAWDAASRAGVFGLYQPGTGHLVQTLVPEPRPIPWHDLEALIHQNACPPLASGVEFIALSKMFEPMGPMPSITGKTTVQTLDGPKPISHVTRDDAVLLEDGRYVQPLQVVRRVLPARGSLEPLRVCAPYFGLERDIEVSSAAHLLMAGSDVEYLLGSEAVLARAAHLRDGRSVIHGPLRTLVAYYQLVFETVEVVQAPVGIQTMVLPSASANSLKAATTLLADMPTTQPLAHENLPFPMAQRYEMVTLNAARAA